MVQFDSLFAAYHDAIFRYCLRRLGPPDAEDAAAEVFVVVWRRLEQAPLDDARAWLFAIAYRVVGNQYRTRRRRRGLAARLSGTGDKAIPPEPEFEALYRALAELSSTDQELLRLSSWDGLTRDEIAQVLGIKENAVDQRLHRARSRLKARFDSIAIAPMETKESPA